MALSMQALHALDVELRTTNRILGRARSALRRRKHPERSVLNERIRELEYRRREFERRLLRSWDSDGAEWK